NLIHTVKAFINYQPDIVLAATNDVPDFITGLKVQIYHGVLAYKRPERNTREEPFRIRGLFELYCQRCPSTTHGSNRQEKKYPHFEVIETGWSKVDGLFPIQAKKESAKPTVMIASTFTKRLSLAYKDDVFDEIKKLSINGDYQFLMVLHPKLPAE